MDGVGTTEGQSEDEDGVSGTREDAHEAGGPHHTRTRSPVHQGGRMQWPTDGSVAVIVHGGKQTAFSDAKDDKEIQLGEAAGR